MSSLEISIPTTSTSTTSPPHTLYNITLRLPLRSFAISKRYSDFTAFHTALTSQTNTPPPLQLPPKSWFSNTLSNPQLRESRRQGLEAYLRAINESDDPRWRSAPVWRAFLNLPSLGNNSNNINGGLGNNNDSNNSPTARLHAAATTTTTTPTPTNPNTNTGASATITDPTLWLDVHRELKSHLHDARLHLTRRDQETTPQRQHESSARTKSSLVRAGTLISSLEDGLKHFASCETSSISSAKAAAEGGGSRSLLGEGEIRRRKDLLLNARKEKDGLEDLLNAMVAKSRVDSAIASMQDKEALVGPGGVAGGGGRKGVRSAGRVLGRETERTRELDNQGVLQLQQTTMQEQDQSIQELMRIVQRQKELGIRINEELEIQNEMLRMADEDVTRLQQKVDVGNKRLGKIS